MATVAPSPGPLSKRFAQTVESIMKRENVVWDDNKDNEIIVEEAADETKNSDVVVEDKGDEDVSAAVVVEDIDDVEVVSETPADVVVEDIDDVEVVSETPADVVVEYMDDDEVVSETPADVVVEDIDDDEVVSETPGGVVVEDIDDDEVVSETPADVVVEDIDDVEVISETPGNPLVKEEPGEKIAIAEEERNDRVSKGVAEVEEDAGDDIVYYKDARIEYEFGEMRKVNGVYFVPLRKPLLVQTPVLRLVSPVSGDSTILQVSDGFAKFIKSHEESILKLTKENKAKWFKNGIEDSALDNGFKSFLESDTLKVKISDEFASFDIGGNFTDICTPAEVRCILEISGVCFGSAEFGSITSLVQAQLAKLPRCSIKQTRERKRYNYAGEFA